MPRKTFTKEYAGQLATRKAERSLFKIDRSANKILDVCEGFQIRGMVPDLQSEGWLYPNQLPKTPGIQKGYESHIRQIMDRDYDWPGKKTSTVPENSNDAEDDVVVLDVVPAQEESQPTFGLLGQESNPYNDGVVLGDVPPQEESQPPLFGQESDGMFLGYKFDSSRQFVVSNSELQAIKAYESWGQGSQCNVDPYDGTPFQPIQEFNTEDVPFDEYQSNGYTH